MRFATADASRKPLIAALGMNRIALSQPRYFTAKAAECKLRKSARDEKRTVLRMTSNDFKQRPDAREESESLSATGMFLRSFDSGAQVPSAEPETPAPAPAPVPPPTAARKETGPGEFTRIFQALDAHPGAGTAHPSPQANPSHPISPQAAQFNPGARDLTAGPTLPSGLYSQGGRHPLPQFQENSLASWSAILQHLRLA